MQSAISQMPPPQIAAANARVRWSANIWPPDSNYNPCADLSTVLITVEGATGSSPMQALMFHRGTYLGTGTVKDYAYMSLNKAASTNDTVVVNYQVGKTCSGCNDGITTPVRYHWDATKVQMLIWLRLCPTRPARATLPVGQNDETFSTLTNRLGCLHQQALLGVLEKCCSEGWAC